MEDLSCYYINLKKDEHRKKSIQAELEQVFSKNQIIRVEAIQDEIPVEGCSQSHILAV